MNLYLSSGNKIADSIYTTSDGRPVFQVKTPWSMFGKKTVITQGSDTVARIRWKKGGSTVLEVGRREVKAKKYFHKGWSGGQTFVAPDGNEYKWIIKKSKPELVRSGMLGNTPVAKFHRKHSRLFTKKRKAYLEVFPAGEHIVDAILVTFIYIETARRGSRKKDSDEIDIDLDGGDGGSGDGGGGEEMVGAGAVEMAVGVVAEANGLANSLRVTRNE
ncbi:hypothetical protein BDZ89DRAFT_146397 [Hymenopellis radicata]|nr:hypothetical protein BDZ89DRAFT_146397 [Hymenopellis radicata]